MILYLLARTHARPPPQLLPCQIAGAFLPPLPTPSPARRLTAGPFLACTIGIVVVVTTGSSSGTGPIKIVKNMTRGEPASRR
jgi:hypothetical protein